VSAIRRPDTSDEIQIDLELDAALEESEKNDTSKVQKNTFS
jgi:hypothetical protein